MKTFKNQLTVFIKKLFIMNTRLLNPSSFSIKVSTVAFCLLANLFFSSQSIAQAPDIEWQKCLGGIGFDYVNAIQQTTNGGFIVAGHTNSTDGDVAGNHGGNDAWVVKLDNAGAIQWQKCLGGTDADYAYSIQQTSGGGYIVAGITVSTDGDVAGNHGNEDAWVVKLDNAGAIEWQKCLGGTSYDAVYSIQQTSDEGYIVAGITRSNNEDVAGNHGGYDAWVVKLDNAGAIEWQKCLGGTSYDEATAIQQTTGGFIVAGYTASTDGDVAGNHGSYDAWIVKLDNAGAIEWQKCLGGTESDQSSSIQGTTDGGYVVAGNTISTDGDVAGNHGSYDAWVVKLDNAGVIQWQKCLGGTESDLGSSIQEITDGGYILAGSTYATDGDVAGNHGGNDAWVVKLDNVGTFQWQKCLGGTNYEEARSIQQTSDGGYIFAGPTKSNDGDVSGNHGGIYDVWVVKLSGSDNTDIPVIDNTNEVSIFPNPTSSSIQIKGVNDGAYTLIIINALGQFVQDFFIQSPTNTVLDLNHLQGGVYHLQIMDKDGRIEQKKLIKR